MSDVRWPVAWLTELTRILRCFGGVVGLIVADTALAVVVVVQAMQLRPMQLDVGLLLPGVGGCDGNGRMVMAAPEGTSQRGG